MSSGCNEYREAVFAAGDDLSPAVRAHLATCADCAGVAVAEERLHRLLECAPAEADEALQARIVAALPRRRAAWAGVLLPLAASLTLALLGAVLMGGVPGGDLVAQLPAVTAQGLVMLAGSLTDWAVAVIAVARTGSAVIPGALGWVALALAFAGLMLVASMAARWRKVWTWS